ncbi:hypothetical protein QTP88_012388 [Uroleucon formosanum]
MSILWGFLLNRLNVVSEKLQKVEVDCGLVVELYDSLIQLITNTRENFDEFERKAIEKSVTKNLSDVKAKAHGLIMQMQSFNFIFALNMLDPILSIILKVSLSLQSEELDLLTVVGLIKSLKHTITRYRSEDGEYDKIYDKTIHMCDENNIDVPKVKKRSVQ